MSWQAPARGLLFDMDGTLVDSTPLIERIWRGWAARHGIDAEYLLQFVHGRRGVETIQIVAPEMDAAAEVKILLAEEMADMSGITQIPGAADFVGQLQPQEWAVVTSAPRDIALAKLRVAGVPAPAIIIGAEEVNIGKPHPEAYQRGAAALGFAPQDCIAFEDADSGIRSAHAAGMHVVAIAHAAGLDQTGLAHRQINHYHDLKLTRTATGLVLASAE
ncbi:HAD family hydrolase [Silvimonas sp. JCM 19000]